MPASFNLSHLSLSQIDRVKPFPEGVATVWLLSTLGGASNLSSHAKSNVNGVASVSSAVKKRDIINVSIPETCMIIQSNEMQIPLRYVSNLLYGVAICYSRKTDYVLSDLTSLLTQLQKKIYNSQGAADQKKSAKLNQKVISATILGGNGDSGLLSDDPLFDITHIAEFEQMLGMVPREGISEAVTIRKQDYLKELTNPNIFEKSSHAEGIDSLERLNHSITLDDIPIDVDFNLDIDEMVSRAGTATDFSLSSQAAENNIDFDVNFGNQEFTLNFDDNEFQTNENSVQAGPTAASNVRLGLPEEERIDEETSSKDEHEDVGPALKKFKSGRIPSKAATIPKLIQYDERTGLSTELLRSNHNDYCELMDLKRKVAVNRLNLTSWQQIMDLKTQPEYMRTCWDFILNRENDASDTGYVQHVAAYNNDSIERGRKQSNSNSNSERSSSNVPSEEMGRKMVLARDDSFSNNNDDLLLNLDQIEEELEEDFSRATSTHQQEFIQMNLELPPSSFGRTHTRTGTFSDTFRTNSSTSRERDAIDVLYHRTGRNTRNNFINHGKSSTTDASGLHSNSFAKNDSLATHLPFHVALDYQARKFYDYIKERSLFVGKTTRSNPPFEKKLLFEDIVPSISSTETDSNNHGKGDEAPTISKKIAANAFLSLLNLASRELVCIKECLEHEAGDKFRVMQGEEIVLYV